MQKCVFHMLSKACWLMVYILLGNFYYSPTQKRKKNKDVTCEKVTQSAASYEDVKDNLKHKEVGNT